MNQTNFLISYAQNCEDIILARIFKPWTRIGHWIDVGAGHPVFDSVTRLFSDFGWNGVNVEPLDAEFSLLCQERPHDINLNCAIGNAEGSAILYEGPEESRGTSSLIPHDSLIASHPKTTVVTMKRFGAIIEMAPWPIDFIKIDVEGMEKEVITSADWSSINATIVVVEATRPNSVIPSHHEWEELLTHAGYFFRLFDGLNRYYSRDPLLSKEYGVDVSPWYPASVQDRFKPLVQLKLESDVVALQTSVHEATKYAQSLEIALAQSEARLISQRELLQDLRDSLLAARSNVEQLSEQTRKSTRRRY